MDRAGKGAIAKGRILIVEDSATQAELLRQLLLNEGYLVAVAANGREGVAKAREMRPDLVVSDIVMPEMTGFELCRRIKDDEGLRGIPVILVTSLNDPKDVVRGLECGADNFITKPYDENYLLTRIEQTLLAGEAGEAGKAEPEITVLFGGERYRIDSNREQILKLLLSTYETAVLKNNELLDIQRALSELNEDLEARVAARTESLVREVQERRRAEDSLNEATRRLRLATASAHLGIWDWDVAGDRLVCDEKVREIFGIGPEREVGGFEFWKELVHPEEREAAVEAVRVALRGEAPYEAEYRVVRPDGSAVHVKASGLVLLDATGNGVRMIGIVQDVSSQKTLEEQLRQAQKMEAIGQFAGGIAHDFNNILTAIFGFAGLVRDKLPEEDPLRLNIDQVIAAAERGAGLTQSLLTFSRKQVLNLSPVDLNEIIRKVDRFLGRIIGEDIKLQMAFRDDDIVVSADAGQIEQVLLNLATNARDAMPQGGLFSIVTEKVEVDREYVEFYGYGTVGSYARVMVSDTGTGMDAETRKRIYDPFFTTKEVGRGTGLGLSIVYGIVKQHKGFINVYSEPGKGTTFNVYLPLIKGGQPAKAEQELQHYPRGGSETILIAEDDAVVRELSRTVLTEFGYSVIEAVNGEDAVRKFLENRDRVQLLLLDMVMPKKNGKEVLEEIRKTGSGIRAIFLSGYPAEVIGGSGLIVDGSTLIMKPVHPQTLLRKIREELDDVAAQRGGKG